ncbi:MAG TPA: triose-phosphate isomerase [Coxiellaceae bacterium]|nr:MAG: triose-phosphate isomerase [Gammaproteobacteria bacterium RBG_16_37_9]HBS51615.1 triose-phosphate isomerase [Coxiellaceae bacterium]
MRIPIIAGNWKMNKTIGETLDFLKILSQELQQSSATTKFEIVIAPSFIAINKMAELLKDSPVKICAQDLFWEDAGAFTGEISAPMLKDAGAKYVIIGHSERRQFFNETDSTVNKKIKAALKYNIVPIFCVGETLAEREAGKIESIIATQLTGGLMDLTANDVTKTVIAYEPVWAIGTGKTATKEQAEEVHLMIRQMLAKQFGQTNADVIRILYGGSVKPSNSKELLSQPNIDGALIGGASLKPEDFMGIIKSAM